MRKRSAAIRPSHGAADSIIGKTARSPLSNESPLERNPDQDLRLVLPPGKRVDNRLRQAPAIPTRVTNLRRDIHRTRLDPESSARYKSHRVRIRLTGEHVGWKISKSIDV